MAPLVFKTTVIEVLGQAGSIPVRLRQLAPMAQDVFVDPRRLPRTDTVLADPLLAAARSRLRPELVKAAVRDAQSRARAGEIAVADIAGSAAGALESLSGIVPVINATGVVLHTNLGRAALSPAAVDAMIAAAGHSTVEFDLGTGHRSRRGSSTISALAARVPDAGDHHVVNNGAAALILAVTVLAQGREILISRGEMVEIGDGFRLPDLLVSTGAKLVEVGTTNRTHLADYRNAIGPGTAAILKVHPSNFQITGFTAGVDIAELSTLGLPVIADVGSGLLDPDPLLPDEPTVSGALRAGAGLVTCSGDKLLGRPPIGPARRRSHARRGVPTAPTGTGTPRRQAHAGGTRGDAARHREPDGLGAACRPRETSGQDRATPGAGGRHRCRDHRQRRRRRGAWSRTAQRRAGPRGESGGRPPGRETTCHRPGERRPLPPRPADRAGRVRRRARCHH